jgi:hypothetical protein
MVTEKEHQELTQSNHYEISPCKRNHEEKNVISILYINLIQVTGM